MFHAPGIVAYAGFTFSTLTTFIVAALDSDAALEQCHRCK
jgi:hypothetical protein